MEIKINKKIICLIGTTIFLISAILYNLLYINNRKNAIIEEINQGEESYKEIEKNTIFVDIGGEVNYPGMYELTEGSRVNDAINIAGGVTDAADLTTVNLAYILEDAIKVVIPKKEIKKISQVSVAPKAVVTKDITLTQSNKKGININTANKEELKTLTGIGDVTAQKIIDYRNENGNFKSKEELKKVPGIGESKFSTIKEDVFI